MTKLNNIRIVSETAFVPEPLYAKKPLAWYVGRWVKTGFQSHEGEVEYMWVKVTGVDSPNLVGQLDNEPSNCTHLTLGDRVVLSRLHIVAIDLTEDEWWEEVSALRAAGDYFTTGITAFGQNNLRNVEGGSGEDVAVRSGRNESTRISLYPDAGRPWNCDGHPGSAELHLGDESRPDGRSHGHPYR